MMAPKEQNLMESKETSQLLQKAELKEVKLVTVYIPCRNYGRFLEKSIESVLVQLYKGWRLILINEGSSDNTKIICDFYSTKYSNCISFIDNQIPNGLQRVANKVLENANTKYIMRLDADDWLEEYALLLMVAKMESDSEIGLVYGNYYYTDLEGKVIGTERRLAVNEEDISGNVPPHGACTMVRTRALKSVGGYNQKSNAQDGWDLWYRLYKRVKVRSVNAPIFYYRQHNLSLSRDDQRLLVARSIIFDRISLQLEGDYTPYTVGVIPVQEAVIDGTPVYKKIVGGMSILQKAIIEAYKSKYVKLLIVTSESQAVLEYAEELEIANKVPIHYRRLRTTCSYKHISLPVNEILLDAKAFCEKTIHGAIDIMVFLNLYSINRKARHIDKAYNILLVNQSDSVVSVDEVRDPIFKNSLNGLSVLNYGRLEDLDYDREKLYRFNGSLVMIWSDILHSSTKLGKKISYIQMSPSEGLKLEVPIDR